MDPVSSSQQNREGVFGRLRQVGWTVINLRNGSIIAISTAVGWFGRRIVAVYMMGPIASHFSYQANQVLQEHTPISWMPSQIGNPLGQTISDYLIAPSSVYAIRDEIENYAAIALFLLTLLTLNLLFLAISSSWRRFSSN